MAMIVVKGIIEVESANDANVRSETGPGGTGSPNEEEIADVMWWRVAELA
jgi:hypothetical protein